MGSPCWATREGDERFIRGRPRFVDRRSGLIEPSAHFYAGWCISQPVGRSASVGRRPPTISEPQFRTRPTRDGKAGGPTEWSMDVVCRRRSDTAAPNESTHRHRRDSVMRIISRFSIAWLSLLVVAALAAPTPTAAQNLPGWAEPSEQRDSRFEARKFEQSRPESVPRQSMASTSPSREKGQYPGAVTFDGPPGGCPPGQAKKGRCAENCSIANPPGWCDSCQDPNPPDWCDDVVPIPVDDHLPLLMLAGIAYAIRLRQ